MKYASHLSAFFLLSALSVFAQGPLAPPSGPGATMKSLDQIEARTPVDAVHTPGGPNNEFIITQSGSYYLTTNITGVAGKNGIGLATNHVTLDLNGFTVVGLTNSLSGIIVNGSHSDIAIRNGAVADWGNNGVAALAGDRCIVENVRSTGNAGAGIKVGFNSRVIRCIVMFNALDGIDGTNGCTVSGCTVVSNFVSSINVGNGSVVEDSLAAFCGGFGIETGDGSTVKNCTADNCAYGFGLGSGCGIHQCTATANTYVNIGTVGSCTIAGCTSFGCKFGDGIETTDRTVVSGCMVASNALFGILLGNGYCSVSGCIVSECIGDGIHVSGTSCTIVNNTIMGNTGSGIHVGFANGYGTRIEGNHLRDNTGNGIQIDRDFGANVVVRNTAGNNGTNSYSVGTGNYVGPIISTMTDPNANNSWSNIAN